jgi:hypothetical protein
MNLEIKKRQITPLISKRTNLSFTYLTHVYDSLSSLIDEAEAYAENELVKFSITQMIASESFSSNYYLEVCTIRFLYLPR